jgi:hypothetical protein
VKSEATARVCVWVMVEVVDDDDDDDDGCRHAGAPGD